MARFIKIESIQSTSHLGTPIDCEVIAQHLLALRFIFDPLLPHKISLFAPHPHRTRFTVFRTGKVVIFGGKCVNDAASGLLSLTEVLHALGIQVNDLWLRNVRYLPPTINNIVSSGYVGCQLHLRRFAEHRHHRDNAIYEVEQFPGLRYRNLLRGNKAVTATIFSSGKCIVTGAKRENEILDGYDALHDIAQHFAVLGTETEDPFISTNIADVDLLRRLPNGNEMYLYA